MIADGVREWMGGWMGWGKVAATGRATQEGN